MSDRIKQYLIDYEEINAIAFEEINFIKVDTEIISPIISLGYDDFFKEEKLDKENFRQQVWELLQFNETKSEKLIIICRVANPPEYYGFSYLENRYILPIQFNNSVNFDAWITALTAKMDSQRNKIITMATKQSRFSISVMGKDELFSEAGFLAINAPKSYKLAAERQVKQHYLDSFQVLDSMQQEINLEETRSLWQEFITIADYENIILNESADTNLFTLFKTETTLELPPELKLIYRLNNGAERLFFGYDLMPLTKVIQEWHNWKLIFDDWSLEELTGNNYADSHKTLGMYTNPRWIPLIDTIGGNFIGMDLMPGKQGKIGQIITFGADTDTITCLANNLNHFLCLSIELTKNPSSKNTLKRVF